MVDAAGGCPSFITLREYWPVGRTRRAGEMEISPWGLTGATISKLPAISARPTGMGKAVSAATGRNNRTFLIATNISQTGGLGAGVIAGTRKPWAQIFASKHSQSKRWPSGSRMIIECVEPITPAVIRPPDGIASPSRSVAELPLRRQ